MDIRSIKSIQRVVNFTLDDGKMVQAEHKGAIIPGVTMTCDLPLLFMNGYPTCLEHLTVGQLEKFIPYMIKCSGISPQIKPKWWPNDMYFSTTPVKTLNMTQSKWLMYLKRLVSSCYSYHGCEYALRLCEDPSHKCRPSESTLEHQLDDTQALYNVPSQRSSAFQSANTTWCNGKSILENCLLTEGRANYELTGKNTPPVQIYLCDTCDAEFSTLKEVRYHERVCIQKRDSFIPSASTARGIIGSKSCVSHNRMHAPNNDPNIHMSKRASQIQCSPECSKKQTARKTIVSGNSRVHRTIETVIAMKHRHKCKNCEQLFVSLKLTRDHENVCLQQQRSNLSRFRSSLNMSSHSYNSDIGQLSSQIVLPYNNSSPQASNNSPIRKRKMSLMPSKQVEVNKVNDLPLIEVFLCVNCNQEFMSMIDIQRHEILCCKMRRELTQSPVISVRKEQLTQEKFLNYFKLSSHSPSTSSPALRVKKYSRNPLRYSAIPVSSMLGNLIHGSQVPISSILSKIEKIERYCQAKPVDVYEPLEETYDVEAWRVSWKPRKTTPINSAHSYMYPLQRWWKMPSLWAGQNNVKERNQRLLRLCKPFEIKIRKLTSQEIHFYSTCRTMTPKLKKLSSKEIQLYTQSCSVSPKLRRLSSQEIDVYTNRCTIAPKIRRLSVQEIKKHVKSNVISL